MRAVDCQDPITHDDIHFTGPDDPDLVRQVAAHISELHPDMSPDEADQIVSEGAYDE